MLSFVVRLSCLTLLSAVLVGGPVVAYPKDEKPKKGKKKPPAKSPGDDLKNKARWEWTCGDKKGTFLGFKNGDIKLGMKRIGSWTAPSPDTVNVTFTDGPLKGKAELTRTDAKRPTFRGELVRMTGKTEKLVVELYDD